MPEDSNATSSIFLTFSLAGALLLWIGISLHGQSAVPDRLLLRCLGWSPSDDRIVHYFEKGAGKDLNYLTGTPVRSITT